MLVKLYRDYGVVESVRVRHPRPPVMESSEYIAH
jgi:hypothetical protein